jgi:hypothetical protein
MTLTPAQLRAWAERLEKYSSGYVRELSLMAREMREAAGEEEPLRCPKHAIKPEVNDGCGTITCQECIRIMRADFQAQAAKPCGRFLADHHEPTKCVLPKGHGPVCSSVATSPELWGVWCVRNGLPGFWRLSGDLQKRIEVPEAQARLVARLANDPHENTHARDGWRYEARPIPRGKDREATRAAFRAQAEKAGPSPVSMLAVEANPSTLPTEAGHYGLTPSGEWRKVERSGE